MPATTKSADNVVPPFSFAHMSGEHASIGNVTERDAPPEVGPLRLGLLCCHGEFLYLFY